MALHSGIDTIAIVSLGVYSEIYGVGEEANIANLYVSFGLLEDAPEAISVGGVNIPIIPTEPQMPTYRT